MIYTVLNPAEVLLPLENNSMGKEDETQKCVTDPYFFLEKDEYYSKYIKDCSHRL